jgi:hypothetical protein
MSGERSGNSTDADHPRHHHETVLERLTRRLDGAATELVELVQEQHPVGPQYSVM